MLMRFLAVESRQTPAKRRKPSHAFAGMAPSPSQSHGSPAMAHSSPQSPASPVLRSDVMSPPAESVEPSAMCEFPIHVF